MHGDSPLEEMIVCALDTTSLSTYSAMLEAAKYGKNKEHDHMQQINLLMICDNVTGIPLYYRSLPGNYSDKSILDTTLKELKSAEFRKGTILLMDRGFYSLENVKTMLSSTFRFLIGLPLTAGFYRDAIQEASEVIHDTENYCMPIGMHVWSKVISIDATRRGRGPNSYEVCLYLFLNPEKLMDEKQKLSKKFAEGLVALQKNPELSKPNNFYGKHYRPEKDEKGQIISMEHDKEAQRRKMNECGFFGYLGPVGLTSERVYALTQNRDYIEKDYEAYKTRMRRPRHSLEEHLEGKIFLVFLSTILEMSIRRKMEEYLLGDKYSFQDLRDEVFSAKWRKPAGKTFDKGHWCDLPIETQKLFHIFKVVKDSELRDDIPKLVEQELFKRKVKHGQVIL